MLVPVGGFPDGLPVLVVRVALNKRRIAFAVSKNFAALRLIHASDYEAALTDLLCDLMHWCDRNDLDFDDQLSRARRYYDEETTSG